jgi:hypothetical protein
MKKGALLKIFCFFAFLGIGSDFLSAGYLPYGRRLPCVLNFNWQADSRSMILAKTSEDIGFDDEIVIPKGTEIHGWTELLQYGRIYSQEKFTMVFPDGRTYEVKGCVMEPAPWVNGQERIGPAGLPTVKYQNQNSEIRYCVPKGTPFIFYIAQGFSSTPSDDRSNNTH